MRRNEWNVKNQYTPGGSTIDAPRVAKVYRRYCSSDTKGGIQLINKVKVVLCRIKNLSNAQMNRERTSQPVQ